MNNKKKFIEANRKSFNIEAQVDSNNTLEGIIKQLYALVNTDYNIEIFTYILFVNYYKENRSGSCGLRFNSNIVPLAEIIKKFKAPGLLDVYISCNNNNDFGVIYSLEYSLSELELMYNELLVELNYLPQTYPPTLIDNIEIYSIDELEDIYRYLKLCECTLTILDNDEFNISGLNISTLDDIILAVEYRLQETYSVMDLKIECLKYLDECRDIISEENLINYKDASSIRTLYSYKIYGKNSLQYIPSGNEVYNKQLALNLLDSTTMELSNPKMKEMKDEVIRYNAIENNSYEIIRTNSKLKKNDLIDYFSNTNGDFYAVLYKS